ncbi:MAG: chromate transporter [Clostridia bacterium]|nr:chromate transporter [Clostridia bacterium]
MIYLQLLYEFCKIGLFAVGGGLTAIKFLQNMSAATGWFTLDQLNNMVAVAESTPGPIGINAATYVGYTTAGVLGSVVATASILLPSIFIVLIAARFLQAFNQNRIVKSVFYGLRPASVGLIAAAGFSFMLPALFNYDTFKLTNNFLDLVQWKGLALAVAVFFAVRKWKPHPILPIAVSAVVGAVFQFAGA